MMIKVAGKEVEVRGYIFPTGMTTHQKQSYIGCESYMGWFTDDGIYQGADLFGVNLDHAFVGVKKPQPVAPSKKPVPALKPSERRVLDYLVAHRDRAVPSIEIADFPCLDHRTAIYHIRKSRELYGLGFKVITLQIPGKPYKAYQIVGR
jgi:hypothetical protein